MVRNNEKSRSMLYNETSEQFIGPVRFLWSAAFIGCWAYFSHLTFFNQKHRSFFWWMFLPTAAFAGVELILSVQSKSQISLIAFIFCVLIQIGILGKIGAYRYNKISQDNERRAREPMKSFREIEKACLIFFVPLFSLIIACAITEMFMKSGISLIWLYYLSFVYSLCFGFGFCIKCLLKGLSIKDILKLVLFWLAFVIGFLCVVLFILFFIIDQFWLELFPVANHPDRFCFGFIVTSIFLLIPLVARIKWNEKKEARRLAEEEKRNIPKIVEDWDSAFLECGKYVDKSGTLMLSISRHCECYLLQIIGNISVEKFITVSCFDKCHFLDRFFTFESHSRDYWRYWSERDCTSPCFEADNKYPDNKKSDSIHDQDKLRIWDYFGEIKFWGFGISCG